MEPGVLGAQNDVVNADDFDVEGAVLRLRRHRRRASSIPRSVQGKLACISAYNIRSNQHHVSAEKARHDMPR